MTTYNFIDRTGQVFGRLTVTGRAPNKNGRTMWSCICTCGNEKAIRGEHLKNKASTSCGCFHVELKTKHGESPLKKRTTEYQCWANMKDRCSNKGNHHYKNYGGRGVYVCSEWAEDFSVFLSDMGRKPTKDHTIERIDNDKGYSPNNCKWVTRGEQVRNRRNSINFTIDGETMCLKDWCRRYGVAYTTARHRMSRGKSIKEALCI